MTPVDYEMTADKTILFVEDDAFVLAMYRSWLKSAGFAVASVADGLAAPELLTRLRPDAIVMDLMLPELHGLELLKFVRTDAYLKATPVVVLFNPYLEGLAAKAMEAGANTGIPKAHYTLANLIRMLRDLVGRAPGSSEPSAKVSDSDDGPVVAAWETLAEETYRDSARRELLRHASQDVARLRQDYLTYLRTGGAWEGLEPLNNAYRGLRRLNARAGLGGCTKLSSLASALEAMLFEIVFQLAPATRSIQQTATQAMDCLARLIQNGGLASEEPSRKRNVLVVDDDEVCNYAIVKVLKRANLDAVSVKDSKAGLAMLEAGPFDLVLLDINMSHLDGFQVCEGLRRMPHHQKTPVIFITANGEFQNRARSILAGGDDLIAKPIFPLELTVKVTIRLLQSGGPGRAASTIENEAKAGVENRPNGATARAAESPIGGECARNSPPLVVSEPEGQPLAQRFGAPSIPGAGQLLPAGVNSLGRGTLRAAAVSQSPGGASAVFSCVSSECQGLETETREPGVAATGPHNKLREQENGVGKLCRENEDLKSASKAQREETARLKDRLDKARAENEALSRQLATLKEEHDATQAQQRQRDQKALEQLLHTEAEARKQMAAHLAEATQLRLAAEDQVSELAGLHGSLEQELAQRKQAEDQLRRELNDQQTRLETEAKRVAEEHSKLETIQATVAELQNNCATVEQQFETVSESLAQTEGQLAQEAKRRAAAESQVSELARLRSALEQELAQRKQTEEQLRGQLEEDRNRLQDQLQTVAAERNKLESQTQELEAAQAMLAKLQDKCSALGQQLESMNGSLAQSRAQLAQEAEQRVAVEVQARELAELRTSLEQELAHRKQAEQQLRQELDDQQTRLETEAKRVAEEHSKLETIQATVAELQNKCAAAEQQLSESVAREAQNRLAAEGQVSELAGLRSALEQELAQRKQAEEKLRRELDEERARLQDQVQTVAAERSKVESQTQELGAAQASLAERQDKCTKVEQELAGVRKALTQTEEQLAQEAERRAAAESQARESAGLRSALEQELPQRKQTEEQLRRQLDEERSRLQAQVQTVAAERSKLESQSQELGAAQAMVAKLQDKCSALGQQLGRVSESLVQEAERRATAEGQARELAELRSLLEQELAKQKQSEAAERGRLQLESETLRATLEAVSSQLKEKTGAEANWRLREAEWQKCVQRLQERITDAEAVRAVQAAEIRTAKEKTAELLLIQSVLCAKVQELTAAESSRVESQRALEEQLAALHRIIQDGQRELAALCCAVHTNKPHCLQRPPRRRVGIIPD